MIDPPPPFSMRHAKLLLLLALPCAVLAGDRDERLQALLERYPDADTNKDGVLTMEEARAHAKEIRRKMHGQAGAVNDDGLPQSAAPDGNRPPPTHADVSYGAHERNKLDLWLAKSDAPTPLVVYIHGGGFVNGSKAGASPAMIRGCLDAGVSYMAINYRFRDSAPIQDILRDGALSVQFVRSKAKEYNLDPERIASYGGSAGAGTSLWLAFHPDLADPKNADPVLRQSSRLTAAGAINAQATYNTQRLVCDGRAAARRRAPGETARVPVRAAEGAKKIAALYGALTWFSLPSARPGWRRGRRPARRPRSQDHRPRWASRSASAGKRRVPSSARRTRTWRRD